MQACASTQADASYGRGLLRGVRMAGRRNAQGSRSHFGIWIGCACASLCCAASSLAAQSRTMTPPPAAPQTSSAPATCAAPATDAQHVAPGRVTVASAGEVAGKPNTKAHQWTVQVASFESLTDAQSMQQSLCEHGYEARVVGAARPYVVRVGRFSTSQDALVTARRLSSPKLTVFVTQAER
jgi:cell division protein FtsN